jgi:hypothetical protein
MKPFVIIFNHTPQKNHIAQVFKLFTTKNLIDLKNEILLYSIFFRNLINEIIIIMRTKINQVTYLNVFINSIIIISIVVN